MTEGVSVSCRICGRSTVQSGLLYRCQNQECGGVHWDKGKITKCRKELKEDPVLLRQVLTDADVPEPIKGKSSHFVYILRLKGELNAVYVGMTGLHPYARYLNHVRGYKSSSHARRRATALISYEGPMTQDAAKKREPELADELREQGYVVYGGH